MAADPGVELLGQVPVDVCFGHFLLIEPLFSDGRRPPQPMGLIEPSPGSIQCRTGYAATEALVSAAVCEAEPPGDLSFDDVVETSYWTESGRLGIADWRRRLVKTLPPLFDRAGWCRLRYHLRDSAGDGPVECVIQAWPAKSVPPRTVKATSKVGKFWHSR